MNNDEPFRVTGLCARWFMPEMLAGAVTILVAGIVGVCCWPCAAQTPAATNVEYLSDHPEWVLASHQAWGELGWNVAAHAAGQAGERLRIGDRAYDKGLGHHASGAITVLLGGEFTSFEAEVGLQPCAGGSVIFRVFVDGQQRFGSGVLRTTSAPQPVHVSLENAQELRLEANDAGDGISCDMANWAGARLTRGRAAAARPALGVDMGRFARVVWWDPHRMDGARASRTEEFRADDVFTEADLRKGSDDCYHPPASADGLGCIGLQWLNRRALTSLELEFTGGPPPETGPVQVQAWFGESAWQGNWRTLAGELQAGTNRLVFHPSPKEGLVQTRKVRWLIPAAAQTRVRRLSAFTRSAWDRVSLRVEAEQKAKRGRCQIAVRNGEFLPKPKGAAGSEPEPSFEPLSWTPASPLIFNVRYSRPSSFKSDPTVLQFGFPGGTASVAVEDVLSNDCVYLPDSGLFVSKESVSVTLAQYKRRIAGRKTVLQQVREMPDQTLAQAMARTHHDSQHEGPVLLSLACDNRKFVLDRDGTLHFPGATNASRDWFGAAGEIRPRLGGSESAQHARFLEGGWLPVPIITSVRNGLVLRERVFVAPGDEPGSNPARLNRPSICVAEFTLSNAQAAAAPATLTLDVLAHSKQKTPAALPQEPGAVFQLSTNGLTGRLFIDKSCPLRLQTRGGTAELAGDLPPNSSTRLTICLADDRVNLPSLVSRLDRLRDETAAYWNSVLAPAIQVNTPEPLLNHLIRSSEVRCLINARNEAEGARIEPWIAAMSYGPLESETHSVLRGMAFMGHEEFARRGLDFFIHRYNTNGFLTTGYTTFGTAWHLWTLGEYYQLYRDTDWLRGAAPELRRVGDWIVRQTEKTKREGAPEFGLMPPGVLADWNAFAYHFTMNAYYYAALRGLGEALADLPGSGAGVPPAPLLKTAAAELRANILRAYRWTQAQTPALRLRDGTWVPHYPSQVHSPGKLADFFPGQDGGRSWCYDVELGAHQLVPTGVLDPLGRETERMMEHMEDVQFLSDGWFDYPAAMNEKDWFNLGGFSKVQPYYCRNAEIYALRDDVKPFVRSYFNTLASLVNSEVMTFWEHFRHSGAWDKTHETGYFLHQTRIMLVTERGEQLWLAPLITTNWLADGKSVAVSNAPTRFGLVSYRIDSQADAGFISVSISPPRRRPPAEIVLRLPHPGGRLIRSAELNGKKLATLDRARHLVRLTPGPRQLQVKVWYSKE